MINVIKFLLINLLFYPFIVSAENACVAPYAIQHPSFNCDAFMRSLKGVTTIRTAMLWGTFGDKRKCLNQLVQDPRTKWLEIHALNETCVSNSRCGSYEPLAGLTSSSLNAKLAANDSQLMQKIKARFEDINEYVAKRLRPDTACRISPLLESTVGPQAVQNINALAQQVFGSRCQIVWNPRGTNNLNKVQGAQFLEKHGSSPKLKAPCIVNLDGEDIDFHKRASFMAENISEDELPRFFDAYSACDAACLWISEYNCIEPGPFKDPRARSCKATDGFNLLTKHIIEQQAPAVVVPPWNDKDDASLVGCKVVRKAQDGSGGFLWKQSDVHPGAVVLFPGKEKQKYQRVDVIKRGKLIDSLTFAGVGNPDSAGDRQHWRSLHPVKDFPFNIVLKADGVCRKLRNPKARIE